MVESMSVCSHSSAWRWTVVGLTFTWSYLHFVVTSLSLTLTWSYPHLVLLSPGLTLTWSYPHQVLPSLGLTLTWSYRHLVLPSLGLTLTWSYPHLVLPSPGLTLTWSYPHLHSSFLTGQLCYMTCRTQQVVLESTNFSLALLFSQEPPGTLVLKTLTIFQGGELWSNSVLDFVLSLYIHRLHFTSYFPPNSPGDLLTHFLSRQDLGLSVLWDTVSVVSILRWL